MRTCIRLFGHTAPRAYAGQPSGSFFQILFRDSRRESIEREGSERFISYTNLEAGTYAFAVTGWNRGTDWLPRVTTENGTTLLVLFRKQ